MSCIVQVEQLDDSMIFYLAALPANSFSTLKQIYCLHTKAKLKGQVLSHTKKGTAAKPPDLKASNFKCLRGIEASVVSRLLCELKECKISIRELSSECKSIKQLHKVQVAFLKGTNSISWEAATQKFPKYATAAQLEPFKKLNFSGPGLPEQFMRFCQRAVAHGQSDFNAAESCLNESDNSFCITRRQDCVGIFWKHDIKEVTSEKLATVLRSFGIQSFPGFSLAMFDLPNGKGVQQQVNMHFFFNVFKYPILVQMYDFYLAIIRHDCLFHRRGLQKIQSSYSSWFALSTTLSAARTLMWCLWLPWYCSVQLPKLYNVMEMLCSWLYAASLTKHKV